MPSIVIKERDLTERLNQETITNVVYIPGYANQGPINTPTLCETLEDFQRIFGAQPYKIRNDQDYPQGFSAEALSTEMGKFYYKNELEKSYIVAQELLNNGIQVLYERIFNVNNVKIWTAHSDILNTLDESEVLIELKSANPGASSSLIKYEVRNVVVDKTYDYNVADTYDSSVTYYTRGGSGTEADPYTYTEANPQPTRPEDITTGNYYTKELNSSTISQVSISVGMDSNATLGIGAIDPITTVFTTNRQIAQQSSSIKLVRQDEPFADNSGLINITIKSVEGDIAVGTDYTNLTLDADLTVDEFSVSDLYTALKSENSDAGYNKLSDKGEYEVKYLTSGAYPIFEYDNNSIVKLMLIVASNRGDCTALIDHTPNPNRTLDASQGSSVYASVENYIKSDGVNLKNKFNESVFNYGAMFTPWVVSPSVISGGNYQLPASFAYLNALAAQLQYTTDWLATAGVTRGHCNILSLQQNITNAIADSYQPRDNVAINPITNIKPYGYTIWGARTLKNNAIMQELSATSFLNIRQITNDVKRSVWIAAKSLTFEQNTDILWIRFKGKLIPLLNQMVQGNAITSYEFVKLKSDKKATIKAIIRLYPIEPVEDWDITIELADDLTVTTEG